MRRARLSLVGAVACLLGALWLSLPAGFGLATTARALARPMIWPFVWRSYADAIRSGSAAESFAVARSLLRWVPQWSAGQLLFAYRFALEGDETVSGEADARTAATLARLQVSLAWLQAAADELPQQRADLLEGMAFLVELAARDPAVAAAIASGRGLGAPAAVVADNYLAAAEASGDRHGAFERRFFATVDVCAAFLSQADRDRAVAVLDTAIARGGEVRDRELATKWLFSLRRLRSFLAGDPSIGVAELAADPHLSPLAALLPGYR
jgi:hypothetical protein